MTLTDTQLVLLSGASQRLDGLLVPARLKGRARDLVAARLQRAGLVEWVAVGAHDSVWNQRQDGSSWALKITSAGLAALGIETQADSAAGASSRGPGDAGADACTPGSSRPVSKKLAVIGLLQRPGGASLDELVEATGWFPHSVRALLTGLRRDGLCLTRVRQPGQGSRYVLVAASIVHECQAPSGGESA